MKEDLPPLTFDIRRHHLQAVVRVHAVGLQLGGDVDHVAGDVVHLQDVVRPHLCCCPEQICHTNRECGRTSSPFIHPRLHLLPVFDRHT